MKKHIRILNGDREIPAIIWGNTSNKILIEIHGNMSNKEDKVIETVARTAIRNGYQAISFDLPKHGERIEENYECNPINCTCDLNAVYEYAESIGKEIDVFACSLGVYFSLLAYSKLEVGKNLFLSPVINMERLIQKMMHGFGISEEQLKSEKRIELPIGEVLDWEYYMFVRDNPIEVENGSSISILYGVNDTVCDQNEIVEFGKMQGAVIKADEDGEHYYHTENQLKVVETWAEDALKVTT